MNERIFAESQWGRAVLMNPPYAFKKRHFGSVMLWGKKLAVSLFASPRSLRFRSFFSRMSMASGQEILSNRPSPRSPARFMG
jgi:hypothetical protein